MANTYNVKWTNQAIDELDAVITYLVQKWSEKEATGFLRKLARRVEVISIIPKLFPSLEGQPLVRKSVLTKQITIYYWIIEDTQTIEILSVFDNRQDPKKRPT